MAATDGKRRLNRSASRLRQGLRRLSLQAAALASLPVAASGQAPDAGVELRLSQYQEADLTADTLLYGSPHRYRIRVGELNAQLPLDEGRWGLDVRLSRETMSGASSLASVRGEDGRPVLLMSGATIREQRNDLSLVLTRYRPGMQQAVSLYASGENDYFSRGGGWSWSRDLAARHWTVSLGAQAYQDRITPTDASLYGRVQRAGKQRRLLQAGLARVVDRNTVVQLGLERTWLRGYLADPYKLADVRPDRNGQWVASLRLRRFWPGPALAQHLDWRYYQDDFGTRAHTWDLSAFRQAGPVHLGLSLRAYRQKAARFYTPFAFELPAELEQSSDFRLSGFGALEGRLQARWRLRHWQAGLVLQAYRSEAAWALDADGRPGHPALVDFFRVTLELSYRF